MQRSEIRAVLDYGISGVANASEVSNYYLPKNRVSIQYRSS